MKFNFGGDMIVCSLVLIAVLFNFSSAAQRSRSWRGEERRPMRSRRMRGNAIEVEQSKTRRGGGGPVGLFAFPRVGRSDPNLSAQGGSGYDNIFPVSYEEYDEYPKISEMKRANLIAFPRVGRSDSQLRKWARMAALQQSLDKRTAPSANSGLWFGPRLGRIQKRSANDEHKDFEQFIIPQLEHDVDEDPEPLTDTDDELIPEN